MALIACKTIGLNPVLLKKADTKRGNIYFGTEAYGIIIR